MGSLELRLLAGVEELRAAADQLDQLLERQRLQLSPERLVEGRSLTGVEDSVVGEVGRGVWLIGRDDLDEPLAAHRLKRVVVLALDADRGHRVSREVLAAQRPRAMSRIQERVIRKR